MKKTAKTLPKTIFQFPPGTRVGQFIEGDHRYVDYGTVKSNDPKKPNNVMVEFDQSAYSISAKMPPEIKSISIKYLEFEVDAKRMSSELEKEFQEIEKIIEVKMSMVSSLIKEAELIAQSKGFVLQDCYSGTRPLMDALESAGWRTSSLGC